MNIFGLLHCVRFDDFFFVIFIYLHLVFVVHLHFYFGLVLIGWGLLALPQVLALRFFLFALLPFP